MVLNVDEKTLCTETAIVNENTDLAQGVDHPHATKGGASRRPIPIRRAKYDSDACTNSGKSDGGQTCA